MFAACVQEQESKWTSTASCTVRSDTGTECFEYDLTMPAERDQLRASCSAPGATFADSDSCETDGRIGGCDHAGRNDNVEHHREQYRRLCWGCDTELRVDLVTGERG